MFGPIAGLSTQQLRAAITKGICHMYAYLSQTHDTAWNMALEAYLFKERPDLDEIFYLWINEPSIILGKHQNALEEINSAYVKEHGIRVHRRISGGGAVYHDLGNLNYTIIAPRDEQHAFDFQTFSQPVIRTLHDLGVEATFSGRNDILIDGRKFCGNAQAYRHDRVLHHGCMLFNVDLSVLGQALHISADKIASKSVKSVRSHVTNILNELPEKISMDDYCQALWAEMQRSYPEMQSLELSTHDLARIEKIRQEQFDNWDWNFGEAPACDLVRRKRYPTGGIEAYIRLDGSEIQSIRFLGDFFAAEDLTELETALVGCRYAYQAVLEVLQGLRIHAFFAGMTAEDVAGAICQDAD